MEFHLPLPFSFTSLHFPSILLSKQSVRDCTCDSERKNLLQYLNFNSSMSLFTLHGMRNIYHWKSVKKRIHFPKNTMKMLLQTQGTSLLPPPPFVCSVSLFSLFYGPLCYGSHHQSLNISIQLANICRRPSIFLVVVIMVVLRIKIHENCTEFLPHLTREMNEV